MARGPLNPGPTTLTDGRQTVTSAGTAVALTTTSTPALSVDITALATNTGVISVGGSGVIAAAGTRKGVPLSAGQTKTFENVDLKDVFIDSTVNAEGVSWGGVAS